MNRFLLFFIFTLPFFVYGQVKKSATAQSTLAFTSGNLNSLQTRNKLGFSLKAKEYKNTTSSSYNYGILNGQKNMDERYLGNFSKFYIKNKWRILATAESESSYMRGILGRYNIGGGLGYDVSQDINISNMVFVESAKYTTREVGIIRNSTRIETKHQISKNTKLSSQTFIQPDLGMKYSRVSTAVVMNTEIIKHLSLTGNFNWCYEQWVPVGKKHTDLSLTMGVSLTM